MRSRLVTLVAIAIAAGAVFAVIHLVSSTSGPTPLPRPDKVHPKRADHPPPARRHQRLAHARLPAAA